MRVVNATLTRSTVVSGNAAGGGGGILAFETATLANSTVSNNHAAEDAGGIFAFALKLLIDAFYLAPDVARRIIRVTCSFAFTAVRFISGWLLAYTRKISSANAWPIDSTAEKSSKTSLNRSNRARIRLLSGARVDQEGL